MCMDLFLLLYSDVTCPPTTVSTTANPTTTVNTATPTTPDPITTTTKPLSRYTGPFIQHLVVHPAFPKVII